MKDRSARGSLLALAGFTGSVLMALFLFAFPALTLPRVDAAALAGAMVLSGPVASIFGLWWWVGLVYHLVVGTAMLPFLYAILHDAMGRSVAAKGIVFGVLCWLLTEGVVFALKPIGVFARESPAQGWILIGGLIGNLIYGIALAAVAEPAFQRRKAGGDEAEELVQGKPQGTVRA